MMVRKLEVVSGLRRIAEDGRNSERGSNERDGMRVKQLRETSEELDGWNEDRRK